MREPVLGMKQKKTEWDAIIWRKKGSRKEREREKKNREKSDHWQLGQMIGGSETKSRYRVKVAKRNAIRKIYNM